VDVSHSNWIQKNLKKNHGNPGKVKDGKVLHIELQGKSLNVKSGSKKGGKTCLNV
jgi:translation initiation factor 1 (eIF-1/SUI1)